MWWVFLEMSYLKRIYISGFRRIHLPLAASLLLYAGACSVEQKQATQEDSPKEEPASPAGISVDEIELAGVRLFKGDGGQGFRIEGQVQNNSPKMTLTEMDVKVVMQDCLDTGVCEILAEEVAKVATNVAAGQAGAFQSADILKDMPAPKGRLGWHYAVVAAK